MVLASPDYYKYLRHRLNIFPEIDDIENTFDNNETIGVHNEKRVYAH